MKCTLINILILLSLGINGFSQKRDYQWVFGDSCGIDFSNLSNPVAYISGAHYMYENFASIADEQGNLACYVNGFPITGSPNNGANYTYMAIVCNKYDSMLVNGDSILSDYSETQGSLLIPFPGHTDMYYLFHHQWVTSNPGGVYRTSLYYSIIDMAANNGNGQVISKNNVLIQNGSQEKLCGVKHGNGRDWWIAVHLSNSADFRFYLLTPFGITDTITQTIGPFISDQGFCYSPGQMKFSKQGDKLAFASLTGELAVYDFDRCSGMLSYYNPIYGLIQNNCSGVYGCAFSASGRFLYTADYTNIYQYDLYNPNIASSEYIVWQDTITFPHFSMRGQQLLGPDDKIYIACFTDFPITGYFTHRQSLSVINNPDSGGIGCNFTQFSFNLNGGETCGGLPNMCNYSLRASGACDSLISVESIEDEKNITVFPNPAKDLIEIKCKTRVRGEIKIVSLLSYEMYSYDLLTVPTVMNISQLTPGVYLLILESQFERTVRKIVIQ